MKAQYIATLTLHLTLTQSESGSFGCQIHDSDNQTLFAAKATHPHQADAIYAALHGLAVQNNFSGCLNINRQPETLASNETRRTHETQQARLMAQDLLHHLRSGSAARQVR